jgi:hypothetical protein
MLTSLDKRVAQCVLAAADTWHPLPGGPEPELARCLAVPLEAEFAAPVTDEGRSSKFDYPGWSPPPLGIDLVVWNEAREPRVVFELKVEAVSQVLYDVFKLMSQLEHRSVEAGYLVVAARRETWARRGECVELFEGPEGEPWHFDVLDLFARNEHAWCDLRGWKDVGKRKSVGCPTRVRETVDATAVVTALADDRRYELRATRIEGLGAPIEFEGDWPRGFTPQIGIPPAYTPGRRRRSAARQSARGL